MKLRTRERARGRGGRAKGPDEGGRRRIAMKDDEIDERPSNAKAGPRRRNAFRDPTARPGEIIGSVINILSGN